MMKRSDKKSLFDPAHLEKIRNAQYRISKVVLHNFKCVDYGEIVLVPDKRKSDDEEFETSGANILGVYGQNGSGKSALVDALTILKRCLSGRSIPANLVDCISVKTNESRLEFSFQVTYADGEWREAIYSILLKRQTLSEEERERKLEDLHQTFSQLDADELQDSVPQSQIQIVSEQLQLTWEDDEGHQRKRQTIFETQADDQKNVFGPVSKQKDFIGEEKDLDDLRYGKRICLGDSRSFLFHPKTLAFFHDKGPKALFYQIVVELSAFGKFNMHVVRTTDAGLIRGNLALPIYVAQKSILGAFPFGTREPELLPEPLYNLFKKTLGEASIVLNELIPGLKLSLKKVGQKLMRKGETGILAEIVSSHDGIELPVRVESDGVRRIISILSLIIVAFNDKSTTLVIDEFDAGIYEYLLGEMLQIFEEQARGQLIFTSHNLRPLEVLDKKCIYFTTTNPANRYMRMKHVGRTNNLRDVYLREIVMAKQDEKVYNETKSYKIAEALRKACPSELREDKK
jgi:AAA15 family ATPase/GTPase